MARSYHFLPAHASATGFDMLTVAVDQRERRALKARGWIKLARPNAVSVFKSIEPFRSMPREDFRRALDGFLGRRACRAFDASRIIVDARERGAAARETTRMEWYWNRIDEKACAPALTSTGAIPSA